VSFQTIVFGLGIGRKHWLMPGQNFGCPYSRLSANQRWNTRKRLQHCRTGGPRRQGATRDTGRIADPEHVVGIELAPTFDAEKAAAGAVGQHQHQNALGGSGPTTQMWWG